MTKIVNFYNPWRLSSDIPDELAVNLEVICCADFNTHCTLWGDCNDENGMVIEELIDKIFSLHK